MCRPRLSLRSRAALAAAKSNNQSCCSRPRHSIHPSVGAAWTQTRCICWCWCWCYVVVCHWCFCSCFDRRQVRRSHPCSVCHFSLLYLVYDRLRARSVPGSRRFRTTTGRRGAETTTAKGGAAIAAGARAEGGEVTAEGMCDTPHAPIWAIIQTARLLAVGWRSEDRGAQAIIVPVLANRLWNVHLRLFGTLRAQFTSNSGVKPKGKGGWTPPGTGRMAVMYLPLAVHGSTDTRVAAATPMLTLTKPQLPCPSIWKTALPARKPEPEPKPKLQQRRVCLLG